MYSDQEYHATFQNGVAEFNGYKLRLIGYGERMELRVHSIGTPNVVHAVRVQFGRTTSGYDFSDKVVFVATVDLRFTKYGYMLTITDVSGTTTPPDTLYFLAIINPNALETADERAYREFCASLPQY